MIIGNGLIANALKSIDTENILFFASGVSNSLEDRSSEFARELNLLKNNIEKHPETKLIYFSSLSVNDQSKQQSPYVLHKTQIENYIISHCKNYVILRIGNVVGKGGNPKTLFNFLKVQINSGNQFVLHKKARRLLVDIDDISKFLKGHLPSLNKERINFSFPYYYNLNEIIHPIESILDKKADYREIEEGDFYHVEFQKIVINYFEQTAPENYLTMLVEKYI